MKLFVRLFLSFVLFLFADTNRVLANSCNADDAHYSITGRQLGNVCVVTFANHLINPGVRFSPSTDEDVPEQIYAEEDDNEDFRWSATPRLFITDNYFLRFYAPFTGAFCRYIKSQLIVHEHGFHYTSPDYILFRVIRV